MQERVRRPAHDKHDEAFGGKAAHTKWLATFVVFGCFYPLPFF